MILNDAYTHAIDLLPGADVSLSHLSPFICLFCSLHLQQSVKSLFVWSLGVIVSCGGQEFLSSEVINTGLSMLVDFGRRGLSS